jgi:hypothetical protein
VPFGWPLSRVLMFVDARLGPLDEARSRLMWGSNTVVSSNTPSQIRSQILPILRSIESEDLIIMILHQGINYE